MDEFEFNEKNTITKEQLADYKYAQEMEIKSAEMLDKSIFSLSAIFIGLVVGFLKEIKTLPCEAKILMIITTGLFILSLLLVTVSYIYGKFEQRCYQRDALMIKYHNLKLISLINNIIHYMYCASFCAALVSLFIFFYFSLSF